MLMQPKSICTCGHTGDGPNSEHGAKVLPNGHGACLVEGCDCRQFTWAGFTPEFQEELDRDKEQKLASSN